LVINTVNEHCPAAGECEAKIDERSENVKSQMVEYKDDDRPWKWIGERKLTKFLLYDHVISPPPPPPVAPARKKRK
jgi:hypothetical protein